MGMRRVLLLVTLCTALLLGGAALLIRERLARCQYVPLAAGDLLAAPDFTRLKADPRSGPGVPPLPVGWSAPARGVQVGSFTITGNGHSFQLINQEALYMLVTLFVMAYGEISKGYETGWCFAKRLT